MDNKIVSSEKFFRALQDAGLFSADDSKRVHRVVIDARAGEILKLYVEYYGEVPILDVAPMLTGIEVRGSRDG